MAAALLALFCSGSSFGAEDKWVHLFNGTDLDGWRILNGQAEYKIKDGVIIGISRPNTPNTFLATEQEYGDFILVYEVKMDNALNSGVQIRSESRADYGNGRVHGYQVELDASPRAWAGGIYDEARRGWLYNLEENPAGKKAYKRGEWNSFRVEAIGASIRVWVNGIQTADLVDEMTMRGFIALQVHGIGKDLKKAGKTVQFRNIKIKTSGLDQEKTPPNSEIRQVSYLNNRLTPHEKGSGWELLWDGKSTDGWRGARLAGFPEKGWKIENGILSVLKSSGGESTNGGDIVTARAFNNFELEVDFKMSRGANSGIKYFVDTALNKGTGSAIGCEYQILDDRNHPDAARGVGGNRTLASLYDLIPANAHLYSPNESTPKRVNGLGWNRARIVVQGRKVAHFLNGIKVVSYERGTQIWKALVAKSKYKKWPHFGEQESGHILLQDHGDAVSFRNIKIRELE